MIHALLCDTRFHAHLTENGFWKEPRDVCCLAVVRNAIQCPMESKQGAKSGVMGMVVITHTGTSKNTYILLQRSITATRAMRIDGRHMTPHKIMRHRHGIHNDSQYVIEQATV